MSRIAVLSILRSQGPSMDQAILSTPNLICEDNSFADIPLELIQPDPKQPRKTFDEERLNELADSIRSKGVLLPILVKPEPEQGCYRLISGERRYRASLIVKKKTIPALIKTTEDPLEISLIENLQRENLNPFEEVEGLLHLKEEKNYTDEQLGTLIGISRSSVTKILALNQLSPEVKAECEHVHIPPKSFLFIVVTLSTLQAQLKAVRDYQKGKLSIQQARKSASGKPKSVHNPHANKKANEYRRTTKDYSIIIRFNRKRATDDEVIGVLNDELQRVMMG